ncbi:MAG: hypothetical protein GY866_17655 [Proteobacteria bacterium]|nr:hypothetical protein [Pseudomonadota bacterium]
MSLFSVIPDKIATVLISRHALPPDMIRLKANGQLRMLEWPELRLTEKETGEMASTRLQKPLTEDLIKTLQRSTDGWAAGLVLMLENETSDSRGLRSVENLPKGEIFDYFVKETVGQFDADLQSFLLNTAVLPRMTAEMTQAISRNSQAEHLLTQLSRGNFFTVFVKEFEETKFTASMNAVTRAIQRYVGVPGYT